MRPILAAMRRAGIVRSRFTARYLFTDRRGFVSLQSIQTPIGEIDHIWIRPEQWHGLKPSRGAQVEFRAAVEPYWHEFSGEQDLGLFKLQVIE